MKTLLLLLPVTLLMFASAASAKDYGRRYKADYGSFDNGFNRQYHYREEDTKCRHNTCLESTFRETDTVYIEETIITDHTYGEQRMVRVYDNQKYETNIVTYYVYNDGPRSHVGGRRFNQHNHNYYYYTPYVMPGLILTSAMMDNFDEQSAALLLAGGIIFDLGLNIATGCKTDDCAQVAGVVALLGVASSVSASISNEVNKNSKTELEKQIGLAAKPSADKVL